MTSQTPISAQQGAFTGTIGSYQSSMGTGINPYQQQQHLASNPYSQQLYQTPGMQTSQFSSTAPYSPSTLTPQQPFFSNQAQMPPMSAPGAPGQNNFFHPQPQQGALQIQVPNAAHAMFATGNGQGSFMSAPATQGQFLSSSPGQQFQSHSPQPMMSGTPQSQMLSTTPQPHMMMGQPGQFMSPSPQLQQPHQQQQQPQQQMGMGMEMAGMQQGAIPLDARADADASATATAARVLWCRRLPAPDEYAAARPLRGLPRPTILRWRVCWGPTMGRDVGQLLTRFDYHYLWELWDGPSTMLSPFRSLGLAIA
ncbi:hypothetical protein FPV67DRAFT_259309 [Lyophyllum atratum]|nr:hypothetical protein FPV67DRAFT_259309 [Lyophyllum atratum]